MRLNCRLSRAAASLAAASLSVMPLTAGCARHDRGARDRGVPQMRTRGNELVELIPRRLIFGNPDRAGVEISPDGRYVSFLAPREGVMNVYVAPAADPSAAKPITNDRARGIPNY